MDIILKECNFMSNKILVVDDEMEIADLIEVNPKERYDFLHFVFWILDLSLFFEK